MKKLLSIILLFAFIFTFSHDAQARRHKKFKGVIVVNQILRVRGVLKDNGNDAPEYSGVKQGDVLETGEKSEAVIRIPGLAIFRMGPNTKFKLAKFNDRNDSRMELVAGNVLALYRRVGDHGFKLKHSTIKLHGTTFYATTTADGTQDQLCLCDGKIQVVAVDEKPREESQTEAAASTKIEKKKNSKNFEDKEKSESINDKKESAPSKVGETVAASTGATATKNSGATAVAASSASITTTQSPAPTLTPTPSPTPLPRELEVKSQKEHKTCEISQNGITELKMKKLLEFHSDAEIQELESMYDLP